MKVGDKVSIPGTLTHLTENAAKVKTGGGTDLVVKRAEVQEEFAEEGGDWDNQMVGNRPVEGWINDLFADKLKDLLIGIVPDSDKLTAAALRVAKATAKFAAHESVKELKVLAAETATPLDDLVVAQLEKGLGYVFDPADGPQPMLAADDGGWKDRFRQMTPEEREAEVRRIAAEECGYKGVVSMLVISIAVRLAMVLGERWLRGFLDRSLSAKKHR